jgi:hypothetical protein
VQILDRAKLWKEGMMDQIKREITIMKDLRERLHNHGEKKTIFLVSM